MDAFAAESLVAGQFPALRWNRRRWFGSGDHLVLVLAEEWFFRFPKDAECARKVARETAFLRHAGPRLPITVPAVEHVGRPTPRYPFPFTGQRRVPGDSREDRRPAPRHWPRVARQLGEFLSALHGLPLALADRCGLVAETPESPADLVRGAVRHRDRIIAAVSGALRPRLAPYLAGAIVCPALGSRAPVVSHADIKGEHILLDRDAAAVTGVIDWADVALCDPAIDLAGLVIWMGPAFAYAALRHYAAPQATELLDDCVPLARYGALRNVGDRLAGEADHPLDLVLRQLRWAFEPDEA